MMSTVLPKGTFCLSAVAVLAAAEPRTCNADTLVYIGSTSNWYTPGNWDLGRLPGAGDDVVIGDGRYVIIDPANDPAAGIGGGAGAGKVIFKDFTLTGGATLETLPGVEFTTRNELIGGGGGGAQNAWGTLIHRSTRALDLSADGTATFGGFGGSGLLLNPTPKNKRIVVLQSSVTFGLGGAAAATNAVPGAFGAGHYATLTTDDATLGGALDVALFYGFTPVVGQTFQIINIGTVRIGEFDGLGEGSLVKRFGDVGLYLSYAGGDGNDVVLTAASVPAPGAAALFGMGGLLAARRRRS